MRLIDADAIEYSPYDEAYNHEVMIAYKDKIDMMPTIDLRSCDGCRYDDDFGLRCYSCSRLLIDRYVPKEKAE